MNSLQREVTSYPVVFKQSIFNFCCGTEKTLEYNNGA